MVGHFADLTPASSGAEPCPREQGCPASPRPGVSGKQLPESRFSRSVTTRGWSRRGAAEYRFDRHIRRPYFTLLQGRALQEKLRSLDPNGQGRLAYAAFSAADIQAPAVRQPRTWLYVNPSIEQSFQSTIEAKPVDSGENLVVLIPDDAWRVLSRGDWRQPAAVHEPSADVR